MDFELLTSTYNYLVVHGQSLIAHWNTQWTLITVVTLMILIIMRKDKPITSLFRLFLNGLKGLFNQIKQFSKKPRREQLTQLFEAIELLTGDHKKRYEIPTYIALSGNMEVSEILKNIDAGHREKLILKQHKKEGNKDWFLFDQGCVISHPSPAEIAADLRQYRPERPIDGIIICLPYENLKNNDQIKIEQVAEKIYQQLWALQKEFGFILPVYLLICNCDEIDGFDEFWKFKDLRRHYDGIFGWSNPNDPNMPFESNWIKGAILNIANSLRHIHINLIKDVNVEPSADILLFPGNFNRLTPSISRFCETVFGRSSYHRAFMFRGLYFSGKLSENEAQPRLPKFLEELFEKKIFAESNLAYAPERKIFSSNDKLRIYQYISGTAFLFISSWLIFDSVDLALQTENLVHKIETVPTIASSNNSGQNIKFVGSVLNHISEMDASKLSYLVNPWSWISSIDNKLTDYFADDIFGDIIFPAFECKINSQLSEKINLNPKPEDYVEWLETLSSELELNARLVDLMQSTSLTRSQVADGFNYLVENIYQEKLPASFYQNSTLYFDAIKNKSYDVQETRFNPDSKDKSNKPAICQFKPIDKIKLLDNVTQATSKQNQYIRKKVLFPREFFEQLAELQSLPVAMSWKVASNDLSTNLADYQNWSSYLKQHWLSGHNMSNGCERTYNALSSIINNTRPNNIAYAKQQKQECEDNVKQQLNEDNNNYFMALYQINGEDYSFSDRAEKLLDEMNKLSQLSFMQTSKPTYFDIDDTDFYWSVEHLNQALRMLDDYESFAKENYQSIHLPLKDSEKSDNYLAQAVALKQLQLAVLNTISDARIKKSARFQPDNLRPISQNEAYLQSHTANFREAKDVLVSIHSKFKLLNFSEGGQWLFQIASAHALQLLHEADIAYYENRLYAPLANPYWGARNYTQALFGISNPDQLKDYLAAQSERINFIAYNYAEPLLEFLKTIDAMSVDYQLYSVWEKTLIELSKHKDKNPANSLSELELFFNNQLTGIDQSNCFQQTKELIKTEQNNLFSMSQKIIIDKTQAHCQSFRADKIAEEYRQVNQLFLDLLAGSYPFSSFANSDNISPATMKLFISKYPGKSSGLAQRMEVLAWKKQEYDDALDFINELDQSIEFFTYLFGATTNSQGIEVVTEFNVLPEKSNQVTHIGNWQFYSGSNFNSYPGSQKNLFWTPDNTTQLDLSWAANSPFTASAINGKTQLNKLSYQTSGTWSLLEFIQRYRSKSHDNKTLSAESILLNFKADLVAKDHLTEKLNLPPALALMRMTLNGLDPETGKKVAIKIPLKFPAHIPSIRQGKKP